MIVSTKDDLARVTHAARRLRLVMENLIERIVIGARGIDLSLHAEKLINESRCLPAFKGYGSPPYPQALCVSVNSCVVHGIPSEEPFKAGDIVGLDLGLIYQGCYADMARTVLLEPASSRAREFVACAASALDLAIGVIKPGLLIGDLGYAMQHFVEQRGFGVVRDLSGHGVGTALHEPPEIPNFGKPGTGGALKKGMVLAIEPMITMGDWRVTIANDGWSVKTRDGSASAHFEDMVLLTEDGCSVLTR